MDMNAQARTRWIILDMLRALLVHVEHYYHTNPDNMGNWWRLIEALRNLLDEYKND